MAVIFQHSCLPVSTWQRVMLCFLDMKQLFQVSCILCYFSYFKTPVCVAPLLYNSFKYFILVSWTLIRMVKDMIAPFHRKMILFETRLVKILKISFIFYSFIWDLDWLILIQVKWLLLDSGQIKEPVVCSRKQKIKSKQTGYQRITFLAQISSWRI